MGSGAGHSRRCTRSHAAIRGYRSSQPHFAGGHPARAPGGRGRRHEVALRRSRSWDGASLSCVCRAQVGRHRVARTGSRKRPKATSRGTVRTRLTSRAGYPHTRVQLSRRGRIPAVPDLDADGGAGHGVGSPEILNEPVDSWPRHSPELHASSAHLRRRRGEPARTVRPRRAGADESLRHTEAPATKCPRPHATTPRLAVSARSDVRRNRPST